MMVFHTIQSFMYLFSYIWLRKWEKTIGNKVTVSSLAGRSQTLGDSCYQKNKGPGSIGWAQRWWWCGSVWRGWVGTLAGEDWVVLAAFPKLPRIRTQGNNRSWACPSATNNWKTQRYEINFLDVRQWSVSEKYSGAEKTNHSKFMFSDNFLEYNTGMENLNENQGFSWPTTVGLDL